MLQVDKGLLNTQVGSFQSAYSSHAGADFFLFLKIILLKSTN
jgi:hypothetical protein